MTRDNGNNNRRFSSTDEDHYVDPTPYKLSKTNQILFDVFKTIIIPVVLTILYQNEL